MIKRLSTACAVACRPNAHVRKNTSFARRSPGPAGGSRQNRHTCDCCARRWHRHRSAPICSDATSPWLHQPAAPEVRQHRQIGAPFQGQRRLLNRQGQESAGPARLVQAAPHLIELGTGARRVVVHDGIAENTIRRDERVHGLGPGDGRDLIMVHARRQVDVARDAPQLGHRVGVVDVLAAGTLEH